MQASTRATMFVLAAILAGCARDAPSSSRPADAPAPSEPAPAPLVSPTAAPALLLALAGDGLDVLEPGSGARRDLVFGLDMAGVLDTLTRVRGAPRERFDNPECGAGPLESVVWADGFGVQFQDGRFVGWGINDRGRDVPVQPRLATTAGIGPGSTRAELEAAHATQVFESTLGTEFSAGGLHGLLESPRADARITSLWAGTTCIFR